MCLFEIFEPGGKTPAGILMKIIEGAAFVNTNSPKMSKSFEDYCDEIN